MTAAQAVLSPGSAPAATTVLTCHRTRPGDQVGATSAAALASLCDSVEPAAGSHLTRFRTFDRSDYLVVVITPIAAGTVHLRGVDVTTRRGPFHRTERTGALVDVTVR